MIGEDQTVFCGRSEEGVQRMPAREFSNFGEVAEEKPASAVGKPIRDDETGTRLERGGGVTEKSIEIIEVGHAFDRDCLIQRSGSEILREPIALKEGQVGVVRDFFGLGLRRSAGRDDAVEARDKLVSQDAIAAADVRNTAIRLQKVDDFGGEIFLCFGNGFIARFPASVMKRTSPDFAVEGVEIIVDIGGHRSGETGEETEESGDDVA